jgi:predicted transcriptional regulator
MTESTDQTQLVRKTVEIVKAFVSKNTCTVEDLPKLISETHAALTGQSAVAAEKALPEPAVPISRSVTPEYIVCLEDGRRLKMLKRHLKTAYGMTPDEYRERWNLPADYPMVAPNYAARRSALAKEIGLGSKGGRRRR